MSAPCSYELCSPTIEAMKRGQRKVNVYRMFRISRNTWDLGLKREKGTGDYIAIAIKKGSHSKIKDKEKFEVSRFIWSLVISKFDS